MTSPSSNYSAQFARTAVYNTVNREGVLVLDPLSQELLDITAAITQYSTHIFQQGEVFTTLVYKEYGNTTLAWYVAYYNGFTCALDLVPGMVIRFPNLAQINQGMVKKTAPVGIRVVI
jgi:hypothetical protein